MKRVAAWIAPALVAAALLALAGPAYAHVMRSAAALLRAAAPPTRPPQAVEVQGAALVVHAEAGPGRVDVGAIAWNLPVLLCLWVWVLRGRWLALLGVALGFVLLHVLVTEGEVRRVLGEEPGWAYTLVRFWFHAGAAALPVCAVAVAWALGAGRKRAGAAPTAA